MVALLSSRRLLALSSVAALCLAACETPAPTGPTARPAAALLSKGGSTPASAPGGPLSGTWWGTMQYSSPLMPTPYQASLTIVQSATGFSGTYTMSSAGLERPVIQDAGGGFNGNRVSLTLRPQKGKPGAQSTTYTGTLSADSSTMTLTATGVTIVLQR